MKQTEIERLLPEVFQRALHPGSPLVALLGVMEELHAPAEDVLEHLDATFAPYRAPDRFVSYLARWVDLERFLAETAAESGDSPRTFPSGLGRLRELVAAAAYLSTWRGTAGGLVRFLETATGVQGFGIREHAPDPSGMPRPFHAVVRAPKAVEVYRDLIERIVEMEKPAYVTAQLEFV